MHVGCSEDESKAKGTFILPITLGMGDSEADQPLDDVDYPENLVDKENCSEDGQRHSSDSPAEGAADNSDELEDESEDEEEREGECLFVCFKKKQNVYLGKRDQ